MNNAELIVGLRECATVGDCSKCKMHDEYSYDMCAIKLLLAAADALEAADARIAKLEAQIPWDEWIKCSERMPEDLTSVIVHRKDGGIFMYEYFDTSPTDECWVDDRMNVYSFYDVTHWMPLPDAPEVEE